ncbi:MAG TPA: DUF1801 domain-containing protein [Xanthomonadaceae bacterium]|jgi:hypothetical protein
MKPSDPANTEARIASFIDKFEPAMAKLIRACRTSLRRMFPSAVEIVYDNYNFFVIGYSPTARPSDTVVSLAAAANGVGLAFYHGAELTDPHGLLLGSGVQNRFIRLPSADVLKDERVRELIGAAVALSKTPFAAGGKGETLVKSVSAKQRPRRKAAKAG